MQRIAVPMIGGMVSSTLLTLIVIPAIFALVKGYRFRPTGQCARGRNSLNAINVICAVKSYSKKNFA